MKPMIRVANGLSAFTVSAIVTASLGITHTGYEIMVSSALIAILSLLILGNEK